MFRHFARILLIGALGTAFATAALTPAAVAQEEIVTVSLTGNATLVAKGAAVDVEVLYSCPSDLTIRGFVRLTQRVGGGRLATGSGAGEVGVCDGAEHVGAVRAIADGSFAFKKGEAVVGDGSIQACNPDFSFCTFDEISGTVRIR
jgi:hypothetical protein